MDDRLRVSGARPISRKQSHPTQKREWNGRFWLEHIPDYTSMLDQHCESYRTNVLKSRARNLFKSPNLGTPPDSRERTPAAGGLNSSSLGMESFPQLKDEIEAIWREKQIPEEQQALFRDCVFSLPKVKAAGVLARELEDLKSNTALVQHALYSIATREQSLATLTEMNEYMSKCEDLDTLRELQQECAELLHAHRILTLAVVESVVKWREQMVYALLMNSSEQALRKARTIPFIWHGVNYLLKLKDDVGFLTNSAFAYLFNFSERSDPFLIFTGTYDDSNYVKKTPKKSKQTLVQLPGGKVLVPVPPALVKRIRLAEMVILEEAVNHSGVQVAYSEPAALILHKQEKGKGVPMNPQLKQIVEDVQGEIIGETMDLLLPRLTVEVWNESVSEERPKWTRELFEDLVTEAVTGLVREEVEAVQGSQRQSLVQTVAQQVLSQLLASCTDSQLTTLVSEAISAVRREQSEQIAPILADSLTDHLTRHVVLEETSNILSESLFERSFIEQILRNTAEEAVKETAEELRLSMLDLQRKQQDTERAREEAERARKEELERLKAELSARKKTEDTAKLREEEEKRRLEAEKLKETADKKALADQAEALRLQREKEAATEAQRLKDSQETERLRGLEEAQRLQAEEARRLKDQSESQRLREAEEVQRQKDLAEAKRLKDLEEAKRLGDLEEEKRRRDQEEAKRLQEMSEAERIAAALRLKAQEEAEARLQLATQLATGLESELLAQSLPALVAESVSDSARVEEAAISTLAAELVQEVVHSEAGQTARAAIHSGQGLALASDLVEAVVVHVLAGEDLQAVAQLCINAVNLERLEEMEAGEAQSTRMREEENRTNWDLAKAIYDSLLLQWTEEMWVHGMVQSVLDNEQQLTKKVTEAHPEAPDMPIDYGADSFTPRVHSPVAYTPQPSTPVPEANESIPTPSSEHSTTNYDLQFADREVQQKAVQDSRELVLEPTVIYEPDIPQILEQYYKLLPGAVLSTLETPAQLLSSMRRGIDARWFWLKYESKIIGLVGCHVDPLSRDARRVTCRHLSSLNPALYSKAIEVATKEIFASDSCVEVRVALTTDPRKELDPGIKAIYSQQGFKWKAVATNWTANMKTSIMGKMREKSADQPTHLPVNMEILGYCEVQVAGAEPHVDRRPTREMALIGNKICLLQVLAALVAGQDEVVTPRGQNRLQSDLSELLEILQSTSLSRFPYMTLSELEAGKHRSELKVAIRWPASETRVLKTTQGSFESVRFVSVTPTQDEIFAGTMLDRTQVYLVNTDDRNLCGFFMVAKELREELQGEMKHLHADLFSKVENLFRVRDKHRAWRRTDSQCLSFGCRSSGWRSVVDYPGSQAWKYPSQTAVYMSLKALSTCDSPVCRSL